MKQTKTQTSNNTTFPTTPRRKIQPLKHKFITFASGYDYGVDHDPLVTKTLIKNPKWCNLSLKLGHTGEYLCLLKLRQARSLRLRSVHLESYSLDSQGCGDQVNRYFGELDLFPRSGNTLKKLSLSVRHSQIQKHFFGMRTKKPNVFFHLKKFVQKQKHLDEFGVYMGSQGNSKWMASLLRYVEKTVKALTIQNMIIDNIFKKYEFPKLETLRFEYMQFYLNEHTFNFPILSSSFQDILALPSLKALTFSQYQRYGIVFGNPDADEEDEEVEPIPRKKIELSSEFWEEFRAELDKKKDKPLKIKYHKKDDKDIQEKVENFKRIFIGLPKNQNFEYEIARTSKLTDEEVKAQGLPVEIRDYGYRNFNHYWKGTLYFISLDKEESISNSFCV